MSSTDPRKMEQLIKLMGQADMMKKTFASAKEDKAANDERLKKANKVAEEMAQQL